MRAGARDTAVALTSRILVLFISLAIQSALAWLLGPEGRGAYAVCLLFATLLGTFLAFGMDTAGQYFVASRRMSPSEGVRATLLSLLGAAIVAMAVGRVLMAFNLAFLEKAPRSSFFVALAVIPFSIIGQSCILLLIGLKRFVWMGVAMVANAVAQLLAALLFIWVLDLGTNGALAAIIVAGATNIVLGLIEFRRIGAFERVRIGFEQTRQLLGYGIRLYVARLSSTVNFRIGTMILAFFATPGDIGIFAAAAGLVSRILTVPTSIETALFSRVAEDVRGLPKTVAQAARVSGVVSGGLLLLLGILSRPVVLVLLSPQFERAIMLIWIMIPGVYLRAASKVLMSYFMGTNRPAVCSWAVGIGMAVNLASIFVLLPLLGLEGAAWAMTLGYVASSLILFVTFQRATGLPPSSTWIPRSDDMRLLAATVRDAMHRLRFGRGGTVA